jgi:hypothetical protein
MTVGQWIDTCRLFVADALGRKSVLIYLVIATVLPIYEVLGSGAPRSRSFSLSSVPGISPVSGPSPSFSRPYPVTAQGLTYNIGRVASAIAPFAVGKLAETYGLGMAFNITAAAYFVSALLSAFIPETKGKELE